MLLFSHQQIEFTEKRKRTSENCSAIFSLHASLVWSTLEISNLATGVHQTASLWAWLPGRVGTLTEEKKTFVSGNKMEGLGSRRQQTCESKVFRGGKRGLLSEL